MDFRPLLGYLFIMKLPASKSRSSAKTKPRIIGSKAFAAITAVEGLKLAKASRERLKALQDDDTLTPAQRRAEVLKAYRVVPRGK